MPSLSKVQRKAMAIAEHAPGKLFKRNKGLLSMTHSQLHDFATTSEKGLPERKGSKLAAGIRKK
jgi:hypothetical protein